MEVLLVCVNWEASDIKLRFWVFSNLQICSMYELNIQVLFLPG